MNPINCAFILSRDYFLTVGHICVLVVRRADYSMQSVRVMLLVAVHESLVVNQIVIHHIKHVGLLLCLYKYL